MSNPALWGVPVIKKILKMTAFAAAVYALDRLKLIPVVAVLAYWVDL